MDADRFDRMIAALTAVVSRRAILGVLGMAPLAGSLVGFLEEEAAGRRKRRKKRHKHGRPRPHGKRKQTKRKQLKRCLPEEKAETCAGRCGSVKNNCQEAVDCGSCECDPPCGTCETCGSELVCQPCDTCCDDVCCQQVDAVCHLETGVCCVPEAKTQTCDGQCRDVVNNCGVIVDCGHCTCGGDCPACHRCDDTTGACLPDPNQAGNECGEEGQVCQADGRCMCEAASCPGCATCAGNGFCEPCSGCCDGGACVADCGVCRTCHEDGQCMPDAAMLGTQCGGLTCHPACMIYGTVCAPGCLEIDAPDTCQEVCVPDVCKADGACAPNVPPVAFSPAFTADEGIECLRVSLSGSDEDGQALTFVLTSLPVNGQLFAYDPSKPDGIGDPVGLGPLAELAGSTPTTSGDICLKPSRRFFHGSDSFTYKTFDGFTPSLEATVSLNIRDIN
jgi:hypothetical protein